MALASTSLFASFDVTDGSQDRDISPFLAEALILDFEFLGRGCTVDFANHVHDTTHYWNYDALNSDQVTTSGSLTSTGTTLTVSSGHGARLNVGDLLKPILFADQEIAQVTDISTNTITLDTKSLVGRVVHSDWAAKGFPVADLVLQQVNVSAVDTNPGVPPRYAVTASTARFTFQDFVRRATL